ncbi:MAG: AAA family ATPase, partial [Gaiellaceae bacterium]
MNVDTVSRRANAVLDEVERAIVGKREALELVLLGMLADGHVLIEDFPGLAKTMIARAFAQVTSIGFTRVQFTPDLMPSDVTGASIYNQREADFEFRPGPIFTNLLLADEINRAPAKVQSALLEVMAEQHVTIAGHRHDVPVPFLVLATQNPIESEGVYPLPEAQRDRFLMKLVVGYPSATEEFVVVERALAPAAVLQHIIDPETLVGLQLQADQVYVDPSLIEFAVQLAHATREPGRIGLTDLAR